MLLVSGAAATLVAFLVAVISLCRGTQKQHYRTVAVFLFTAGTALNVLSAFQLGQASRVPTPSPHHPTTTFVFKWTGCVLFL